MTPVRQPAKKRVGPKTGVKVCKSSGETRKKRKKQRETERRRKRVRESGT